MGNQNFKAILRLGTAFCVIFLLLSACQDRLSCSDPIGCIALNPGQPLTIGVERATTGDENAISQAMVDAIKKASGQQPLFYRHPVQFYIQDTPCTLHDQVFTTGLLVSQPDLAAVIGPACPVGADVYAKSLSDAGILLLSASQAIDTTNLPGVFNLFPSTQDLANGLDLLLSKSPAFKDFGLVVWNETIDSQFAADFCALWQKHSFQCSQILSLQPDNMAASNIANQLANTSANLMVVLPFTYLDQIPDFQNIFNDRKVIYFDPEINGWNKDQDPFRKNRSVVTYHWQPDDKSAKLFSSAEIPEIQSLLAYDAYNMLIRSLSETTAVMPDGKIDIQRQELRQSFAKIVDYSGLAGIYTCAERFSCLQTDGFLELETPSQ